MAKRTANYTLAGKIYRTKQEVVERCRAILNGARPGAILDMDASAFLLALFCHHTQWTHKHGPGVSAITVKQTRHGTRCFWLIRVDGQLLDISFMHAIKHLPTGRTSHLAPQALVDFKNAARQAIKEQIDKARDACACGPDQEVDHVYPRTFDALLFGFCLEHQVNPLSIEVIEREGCLPYIVDRALSQAWQDYHTRWALVRAIGKADNMAAPKVKRDWSRTWDRVAGAPSFQPPDVYTRTCPVCGGAYQADDYDDPDGHAVWAQWEGPCCASAGLPQA